MSGRTCCPSLCQSLFAPINATITAGSMSSQRLKTKKACTMTLRTGSTASHKLVLYPCDLISGEF